MTSVERIRATYEPAIIQAAIQKILGGAKEVKLDKTYNKWSLT